MKQYKKHNTNNERHSKYKFIYYQNTHTLQTPHIHTPTLYKTSYNNHSTRYTPIEIVKVPSSTLSIRSH